MPKTRDLSGYNGGPNAIRDHLNDDSLRDLQAMADEPLSPELKDWVEDGPWGPMLRHPLVYMVPLILPGHANRALAAKRAAVAKAVHEKDWGQVVFLHERPYRLKALIDYVVGHDADEPEEVIPLCAVPEHWELAADVWVDSENIEQELENWRALVGNGDCDLWLGSEEEHAAFAALPDPIPAYRGGSVGDWSWTTDFKIAEFFSRRSGLWVREALIPKADCFGYLTRRGESELLVRLTPEREALVYPNGTP